MLVARSLVTWARTLNRLVETRLWLQVLAGMALGVAAGAALSPGAGYVDPALAAGIGEWVALPGDLFLAAVQFVVIPLVVASVVRGIAAGGSGADLGPLGLRTILFFVVTTALAAAIGIALALGIEPGAAVAMPPETSVDIGGREPVSAPTPAQIPDLILNLFPRDPLATFVSGNLLQIVIAAVLIGVAMTLMDEAERKPLLDLLSAIQGVAMVIVGVAMRFAPIAVFALIASITARVGIEALLATGLYVATVFAGLAILFAIYLAVVWVIGRVGPLRFIRTAREAILLAFSTSSSAVVMPITLRTVERDFGVSAPVVRFVVPLGTTINMAGTALYQGVATVFLAQVYGVDLGPAALALVVVMATGASIGSPGTPGVGIVILASILASVGIPADGIAILLGVDRILDMARTSVNVTGDMAACLVVERLMGKAHPAASPQPGTAEGTPA